MDNLLYKEVQEQLEDINIEEESKTVSENKYKLRAIRKNKQKLKKTNIRHGKELANRRSKKDEIELEKLSKFINKNKLTEEYIGRLFKSGLAEIKDNTKLYINGKKALENKFIKSLLKNVL